MGQRLIFWISALRCLAKWGFFVIILAGFAVICLGQYKAMVSTSKKIVQLPEPRLEGPVSLEQTLTERRSVREFTSEPLNLEQIGQLAWAAQGVTEKKRGFRTAPSAGAIYPMKLYFATQDGVFVYHPEEHSLEKVLSEDVRNKLSKAALRQSWMAEAACDVVIAGSEQKVAAKYGNRARRYMLLEAGHIAQNIHLQAVSLKLGSVSVGAFDINQVHNICSMPRALEPIYIIPVGHAAGR